jgi:sulfate adenylyltransferase
MKTGIFIGVIHAGGGTLKPLLAPETERAEELKRAATLKQAPMSSRETSDLVMLAMGAYTPLDGFMGEADWRGVCTDMKMADGLFWPIPITLSAEQDLADSIGIEEEVALVDADSGEIMGILEVTEKTGAGQSGGPGDGAVGRRLSGPV